VVWVRRFDCWAASYDASQLQTVLYGPVHEAVLRYARHHVQCPARILDVGCGTGRLLARVASAYQQAQVVGVDASTEMIKIAVAAPDIQSVRYASAVAEQLPFADAVFDLVVVTLSVSHWRAKAAGLAEISRVMAPGATLVAAEVLPARPSRPATWGQRRRLGFSHGLPSLITASGLRVDHVEPVWSIAIFVDTALIAAQKRC
jgi:ubiquinone/menaquinone biosynthesis C-methylase UbiE